MDIDTILLLNNALSSRLARSVLQEEGIASDRVALFLLREAIDVWPNPPAEIHMCSTTPQHTLFGQRRVTAFYWRAARRLRQLLATGKIRRIMIVNNDNLLCAHALAWASRHPGVQVDVIAEGIMNYQNITMKNRESWRWLAKPVIAKLLLLRWRKPIGHLSAAFDPATRNIYSFSASGLQAPPGKARIVSLQKTEARMPLQKRAGLLVHTGLWRWMDSRRYDQFMQGFLAWIKAQGFSDLYAKKHPYVAIGPIEHHLPGVQIIGDGLSLEEMAADISAATVFGTCCTGLVTLKTMRPDLNCVDYGADFYCEHAYHGDHSVEVLMEGAGVCIVKSGSTERVTEF